MNKIGDIDYISGDEIIEKCKCKGIEVSWRKLNYYKTLGLLPKAIRIEKDKRGYYPSYIVFVLSAYHFLQHHLGMTLDEIKKLVDKFKEKKSDNPIFFYMVAHWMHITYGQYLIIAMLHIKGRERTKFGAVTMGVINYIYRKLFEKTVFPSANPEEFDQKAKEWAGKAVNELILIMDKVEKN